MIFDPNFLGKNGFYWFFGVVEDRNDPLKLGRVRVRAHGWHTETKGEIPTDQLPWATVAHSTHSAALSSVGETSNLVENSFVVGFFVDGIEAQEPLIIASVAGIPIERRDAAIGYSDARKSTATAPKIVTGITSPLGAAPTLTQVDPGRYPRMLDEPDTPRIARNELEIVINTLKTASRAQHQAVTSTTGTFSEPALPYAAVYPYNHVRQTESGHVFELDDTQGAERVALTHRSATGFEYHPNGTAIYRTLNFRYDLTHNDYYSHVGGHQKITVSKNCDLYIKSGGNLNITAAGGNATININGNAVISITGNNTVDIDGNNTVGIDGNNTVGIDGNNAVTIGGNTNVTVAGTATVNVSGQTTLTSPNVSVVGNTAITG